jgi:hypothetical protein
MKTRIQSSTNSKLVYADLAHATLISDEDMKTFEHKTRGKGTGGTIIDENGQKREVITRSAYNKRKLHSKKVQVPHETKERRGSSARKLKCTNQLVYADLPQPTKVNDEDMKTFNTENHRGKGGYIIDENGQEREVITRAAYYSRKALLKNQQNQQNNQQNQQLVYGDLIKHVPLDPDDDLTFALTGFIEDKNGNKREVLTQAEHQKKKNALSAKRSANQLVYADLPKPTNVSDDDIKTLFYTENNHGKGGYITDKNGQEREVITRCAYSKRKSLLKMQQTQQLVDESLNQQPVSISTSVFGLFQHTGNNAANEFSTQQNQNTSLTYFNNVNNLN